MSSELAQRSVKECASSFGASLEDDSQLSGLGWLLAQQHHGISLGLDVMKSLLQELGHPEKKIPVLHIAGTNGKGSVAACAASLLKAAGVRAGLYTSPHLVDFRERIMIEGEMIAPHDLEAGIRKLQFVTRAWSVLPTFFELTTALAFDYLAHQGCDVIILETGLGGRLDATNVLTEKIACAITPISLDHQEWLGPSLEDIAREKAGIIRSCVPVITAPQKREVIQVLQREAEALGAPFMKITEPLPSDSPIGLIGSHQLWNAALALKLVESGPWKLSQRTIQIGLQSVVWPGRFERMPYLGITQKNKLPEIHSRNLSKQEMILDGAHNPAAIKQLVLTWREQFEDQRCILIFGALSDKPWQEMLSLLEPIALKIILVPVASPRSVDPAIMAKHFSGVMTLSSLQEAFDRLTRIGRGSLRDQESLMNPAIGIFFQKESRVYNPVFTYPPSLLEQAPSLLHSDKNLALESRSYAPILLTGSLFLVGEALSFMQGKAYHSSAQ
jgi:dihydrofolate synthase/folylpolyglutamate synthase